MSDPFGEPGSADLISSGREDSGTSRWSRLLLRRRSMWVTAGVLGPGRGDGRGHRGAAGASSGTRGHPGSTHQGETRQRRIEEFLEDNDVPVLALREGAWPGVSGRQAVLAGASTGRLFRRGVPPASVPAGTDLSFLLDGKPRFDVRAGG